MEIVHYQNLYLLLFLIPLLWLWIRYRRLQKARFARFAELKFYKLYLKEQRPVFFYLRLLLRTLAFCALVLALLRPQWGFQEVDVDISSQQEEGLDLVFVVDVSKSMDATDIKPSRLYRARMNMVSFINKLKKDRLGLVAFAGASEVLCPLTEDLDTVTMMVNSLSTNTIAQYGTDIGMALNTALDAFSAASENRILILVSDGEDLGRQVIPIAHQLKQEGVVVHCLGVGSDQGVLIEHPENHMTHLSKLDAATLKEIARITGGDYYSVLASGGDISSILQDIYAKGRNLAYTRNVNILKDQFQIFALLALIFLLLDILFAHRQNLLKPGSPIDNTQTG